MTTPKRPFHTASEADIKRGEVSDVYFARTVQILIHRGDRKRVKAEVYLKSLPEDWRWGILAGLEEAAALLEGVAVDVLAMDEGTVFEPYQPVLRIEGTYVEWAQYETALLGLLCQASGIATKAARCKKAAGDRQVISFGARRMHPALAPMIERNAFVGGCDGVAVTKSAELIDADPTGTIPHSLVLMIGDTVEALKAFHDVIDPKVRRVALIDTLQDEKFEAIRVAQALGRDLYAVRLDTPSSRRAAGARTRWPPPPAGGRPSRRARGSRCSSRSSPRGGSSATYRRHAPSVSTCWISSCACRSRRCGDRGCGRTSEVVGHPRRHPQRQACGGRPPQGGGAARRSRAPLRGPHGAAGLRGRVASGPRCRPTHRRGEEGVAVARRAGTRPRSAGPRRGVRGGGRPRDLGAHRRKVLPGQPRSARPDSRGRGGAAAPQGLHDRRVPALGGARGRRRRGAPDRRDPRAEAPPRPGCRGEGARAGRAGRVPHRRRGGRGARGGQSHYRHQQPRSAHLRNTDRDDARAPTPRPAGANPSVRSEEHT